MPNYLHAPGIFRVTQCGVTDNEHTAKHATTMKEIRKRLRLFMLFSVFCITASIHATLSGLF